MTRVFLAAVIVGLLIAAGVNTAQERLKFDAPQAVDPGAVDFALARILFDPERSRIEVTLREVDPATGAFKYDPQLRADAQGKEIRVTYTGEEAMTLMTAVNKMDFSGANLSLYKRIMAKLVADKKIPAAVVQ